jgi:hypothetical protein
MKNLFNNIDSSEKNRILEMHKKQGYSNINEQPVTPKPSIKSSTTPTTGKVLDSNGNYSLLDNPLYKNFENDIMGDGVEFEFKSNNVIKIFGPTGVWTLSKSNL